MYRLAHERSFLFSSATMIVLSVGCHRQQPAPVSSNTPISSITTNSNDEVVPREEPFELESDFTKLTREDFETFQAETETWNASGDGIVCTGKPRGYLYSKQPYTDFTLRLDLRFPRPANLKDDSKFKGNTGILVYITGEHKMWPVCLEVQGKNAQMGAIKENGGAEPVTTEDNEDARQKARKPVGQWNLIEVVSKAGALHVSLNGTPIANSQPGPLTTGLIGIQAEDHPFEIRHMRIRSE